VTPGHPAGDAPRPPDGVGDAPVGSGAVPAAVPAGAVAAVRESAAVGAADVGATAGPGAFAEAGGWWATWIGGAMLAAGVALNLIEPQVVTAVGFFAVAPVVTALSLSLWQTGGMIALVFAVYTPLLFEVDQQRGFRSPFPVAAASRLGELALTALLSLGVCLYLRRKQRQFRTLHEVAEAVQLAVLPPAPARVGRARLAVRYATAAEQAQVGGDLYAVHDGPYGLRLLIGDVRGKGLGAVPSVAVVIGAFRVLAAREPELGAVARGLEDTLRDQSGWAVGDAGSESFVTAVAAEFPADGRPVVRLVDCGHPAPLVVDDPGRPEARVRRLEPADPGVPLGLGDLAGRPAGVVPAALGASWPEEEFPFPPGSTLLLYTDGLTEARSGSGEFYDPVPPLAALARRPSATDPGALLDELVADVRAYVGGPSQDDMALLAAHRLPQT
jgi:serine phosphatase RsbU (regulator of sigma subunit)